MSTRLFEPSYAKSGKSPSVFSRLLGFISSQCKLIFSETPDVVYVRWHFATILVSFWAKVRNVSVIQEINGPYEDLFLSYPWTKKFYNFFVFIMRQQLKWADAVVVVTPHLVDWVYKESRHRNIHIVSNGANTTIFNMEASVPNEFNLPKKYVVFFGALSVWQGVEVMLAAIHSNLWPADVALVIIGDGVERRKVIEATGSSGSLFHFETVEQGVLAGIVCNSLGSLSPQVGHRCSTGLFPLKLFESLACAVPVVVSDWPGMADFVRDHQCGIVVPPGDPDALARAVSELAGDPASARIMGGRGAEVVRLSYSWEAKAEETFHIICDVLSNNLKKSP